MTDAVRASSYFSDRGISGRALRVKVDGSMLVRSLLCCVMCLLVLSVVQILREAMRTSPSIVYLPHLSEWWHVITEAVQASFISMFNDLDPSVPVLLLATSDTEHKRLYPQVSVDSCASCL